MGERATGTFEVNLNPLELAFASEDPRFGRLLITKQFFGDLEATSSGEMLSLRSAVEGSAGYVAIEFVTGRLGGHEGSFVLQHSSTMDRGTPKQKIQVIPDSGTKQLQGLTGELAIDIVDGQHHYTFDYALADSDH